MITFCRILVLRRERKCKYFCDPFLCSEVAPICCYVRLYVRERSSITSARLGFGGAQWAKLKEHSTLSK